MKFLVTGSAGFIGYHLSRRLLSEGHAVVGFDALTPYYDVRLKEARHDSLRAMPGFTPVIARLEDSDALSAAFETARPEVVFHFAAQAGVRYSVDHPRDYLTSNLEGSFNVLETAARAGVDHLLIASTSSVYGASPDIPFTEAAPVGRPLSFYAATKVGMEAMAHSHAGLHAMPTTAFRLFTVYGPWGRPDMALFRFCEAILAGRAIDVYGEGRMTRDLTYVDDVVEALVQLIPLAPAEANRATDVADSLSPEAPFRTVNVGGGRPVSLDALITAVERAVGQEARRNLLPLQAGDMRNTAASPALLDALTGATPATPLDQGVAAFVDWYRDRYG